MTKIIELFGSPSAGKSTTAAHLFALMKQEGYNVELAREVAKEYAWQGKKIDDFEQVKVSLLQIEREAMLLDKVDFIITDSPVTLGIIYSPSFMSKSVIHELVQMYNMHSKDHKRLKFRLIREKPYNPKGRFQTEAEANMKDKQIEDLLQYDNHHIIKGIESMRAKTILDIIKGL